MNAPRRRALLPLLALLTVPLAACTPDAPEGFCASWASLEAVNAELATFGADDPEGTGAQLEQVATALAAVEPPAAVAAPFDVYAEALSGYTDAATQALADLENVDQEAVTAATRAMTSAEVGEARGELASYTAEHCS